MNNSLADNDPSPHDDGIFAKGPFNPYHSPEHVDSKSDSESMIWSQQGTGLLWMLFSFDGRIPRRVFWGALFASTIAFYSAVIVLILLLGEAVIESVVIVVLNVPLLWGYLAIMTKRWHDRNKSGAWILVSLIPFIGLFWLLVELGCRRGTIGDNRYGPDPT
jgi:uncharacterized membrane protein YhaH (DUF805 family)